MSNQTTPIEANDTDRPKDQHAVGFSVSLGNVSPKVIKALIDDSYDTKAAIYQLLLEVSDLKRKLGIETWPRTISFIAPDLAQEFGVDLRSYPLLRPA